MKSATPAKTLRALLRPLLIGVLLGPTLVLTLTALGPVADSMLGLHLIQPAAAACTNGTTTDYWQDAYRGNRDYSTSRLLNWQFTMASPGWCYAYHFASYNGGSTWFAVSNGGTGPGVVIQVTAGADGYANSVVGNALRYKSCSTNNVNCSGSNISSGSMNNNLLIDTVYPAAAVSVPYSNYTNSTAFNTTHSASDGGSGISNWALYRQSAPVSGTTCQTGSASGWSQVDSGNAGNVNSTYPNSGLANATCYQWAFNAVDLATNLTQALTGWLMIDTQNPTFNGYLNATCFSPGQSVTLTQSGSSDPTPGSGLNGQYYYYNNWVNGYGWTTNGSYSYTVPTPTAGTQGSNQFEAGASDRAGNYQWSGYSYSVDNTAPTGGSISASASVTNQTSVNLSFGATAGGCRNIDNVAISNDQATWWYSGSSSTSFGAWNFTGAGGYGGGNANQGTHTIYVAFHEAGAQGGPNGDGWSSYYSTTLTYDSVAPVASVSDPIGPSATNQTSFNTTYSASDSGSGVSSWQLYVQSAPVSGNTCQTGSASGWSQIASGSAAVTNATYPNSGLANATCYQWKLNVNDLASNNNYAFAGWVMIDTTAPSAPAVTASGTNVYQAAANGVVYFKSGASGTINLSALSSDTDNGSGVYDSTYGTLSSGTGWTYTPGLVYVNPAPKTLAWASNAGSTSFSVTSTDQAGNTSSATAITVTADATAPAASAWTPAADAYRTVTSSFTDSWSETETGSGLASRSAQWQSATLAAGACGSYSNIGSSFTPGAGSAASTSGGITLSSGNCYRLALTLTDNVGNSSLTYSPAYKIDTSAPVAAGAPTTNPTGFTNLTSVTITVGAAPSDPESGITGTAFYRQSATLSAGACGSYGAASLVTSPDSVSSGICYVYFTRATNGAGLTNDGALSAPVKVDAVAPSGGSVVINGGASATNSTSVTLTLSATDPTSGLATMAFSNDGTNFGSPVAYGASAAWTLASGDGSKTVYARFTDAAGNTSANASASITLDTVAPAVSWFTPSGAAYSASTSYTPAWTVTDATSGVASVGVVTRYVASLTNNVCGSYSSNGTFSSGSGETLTNGSCYYWSFSTAPIDVAGNTTSVNLTSAVVKVDTTAPSVTWTTPSGAAYATATSYTPAWTVTDSGSGLASAGVVTRYVASLSANVCGSYSSNGTFSSGSGETLTDASCYYWSFSTAPTDNAGNTAASNLTSAVIKVDTAAPTGGTVVINAGATATNTTSVTLTLSATDLASGLASMQFSNNGTNWGGWGAYSASAAWTLPTGDGSKTVYAQFRDAAGNVSGNATASITMDTVAPTIAWTTPSGAAYATSTSYTPAWTITDTGSGVASVGVVTRYLATFTNNSCGSYSGNGTFSSGSGETLTTANCYYWSFTTAPSDNAGNTTATNLTSAVIKVDTTAPVAAGAPTTSPTGFTNLTSVTISVGAAPSDPESGIAGTAFYRQSATLSAGACGSYGAASLVTSPDSVSSGNCYVYFTRATNGAGLTSDGATSAPVKVDTAAPTGGSVVINAGATYAASTTVTLTLSATDPTSGLATMAFSNDGSNWGSPVAYSASASWTLASGDGSKTVYARFTDAAGNVSANATATITLDATAPTSGSVVINGGASATNSTSVTLTLSATDPTSGVATMAFSNDGSNWGSPVAYSASASWTLSSGDGSKTVYARFTDAAGNTSANATASITLDTAAPTGGTLSINAGASYTNSSSVNLTTYATDATSGMWQMRISNDNVTWTTVAYSTGYSGWSLTSGDGAKTVYVQYEDHAGNWSGSVSHNITLDTAAPTGGSVVINAGASYTASTSVTLTLSASDSTSGVASMQFSNNGSSWGGWTGYSASAGWTLASGDGAKTVYAQFKDNAGNVSGNATANITLDTAAPSAPAVSASGTNVYQAAANGVVYFQSGGSGTINLSALSSDAGGSGVASSTYGSLSSGTGWTYTAGLVAGNPAAKTLVWASNAGSSGFSVTSTDAANNSSGPTAITVTADATAPAATWTAPTVDTYRITTSAFTVTWSETETGSGLASRSAQWQSATLAAGACGSYGNTGSSFTPGAGSAASTSGGITLSSGYCYRLGLTLTDNVGNSSLTYSPAYKIDTAAPTGGSVVINAGATSTNNAAVTLTLSASDSASGLATMAFSNDGTNFGGPVAYSASAAYTLPGGDGTKTVYARFTDAAGNTSANASASITLDTAAPTGGTVIINAGASYTASTSVTLTLSATDTTSGVASMQFSNNGTNWGGWGAYSASAAWTLSSGDGSKTVYAQFRDAAGNVSANATANITLDTAAPTGGTVIINAGASYTASTSVTLTLSATDTTSGVASMQFSNNGSSWGGWTGYSASSAWTLSSGDGSKTVYAQFRDAAGNVSANATANITLDTAAPTAPAVTASGTGVYQAAANGVVYFKAGGSGTINLSALSSDAGGSGVASSTYGTLSSSTGWTYTPGLVAGNPAAKTLVWASNAGSSGFSVTSTDAANNSSGPTAITVTADATAPAASAWTPSADTYRTNTSSFTDTWSETETGSGLASRSAQWQSATLAAGACGSYGNIGSSFTPAAGTASSTSGGITLTSGNCYRLALTLTDNVGNVSTTYSPAYKIDSAAPTGGSVVINAGATSTNTTSVTLTLSATDLASGLSTMAFSNDGTNFGGPVAYSASAAYTLPGGDGTKTVYARFTDAAGNVSANASANIILDTAAPTVAWTTPSVAAYATSTSYTPAWTVTDSGSGLASAGVVTRYLATLTANVCGSYSSNGTFSSGVAETLADASCYYWSFTTAPTDVAGNTTATNLISPVVKVDTTAPTVVWTTPSVAAYATSTSYTPAWTVTDSGSGLASAGVVTRYLATLTANVCGSYSSNGTFSSGVAETLTDASCYYWSFTTAPTDLATNTTSTNLISAVIKVDTSAPSGSVVINAGATATNTTSVTLTLSATDLTSGVASMQFSNNGTNWGGWGGYSASAAWTLASGDGSKTVYAQFKDNAGNVSGNATASITLDTAAPTAPAVTASGTGVYQAAANGVVYFKAGGSGTINLSALSSDAGGSGVASSTYGTLSSSTGWTYTPGLVAGNPAAKTLVWASNAGSSGFSVTSTDAANNSSGPTAITVTADATAPAATWTAPTVDTYRITTSAFTVTWSETETGSGLATRSAYWQAAPLSGGACGTWANPGSSFTPGAGTASSGSGGITVTSGNCYRLSLTLTDNVGNVNYIASPAYKIDSAAPTGGSVVINAGATSTNNAAVTLTLSATDTASGLATMAFSNDGTNFGGPVAYSASSAYTLPAGDGSKTVYARFTDAAGNTSGNASASIILDTAAPTGGTVIINAGASYTASTSVTLTLSASDSASGLATMAFSNDGTNFGGPVAYSASSAYTLPAGDGSKTVYARFTDAAGNTSGNASASIILDTAAPTGGTVIINAGASYTASTSVTLTLSASDSASGLATMAFSNDGTNFGGPVAYSASSAYTLPAGDGTKTVYARFTDAAGNTSGNASASIILDTVAPTAPAVTASGTGVYQAAANGVVYFKAGGSGTINLSALSSDAGGSGVASSTYGSLSSSTGWTYTPGLVAGNPAAKTLVWASNAGSSGFSVTSTDAANNSSGPTAITVTADATAPAATWTAPTVDTYRITTSAFTVTWSETETGSGLASRSAQWQSATLAAGACGSYGNTGSSFTPGAGSAASTSGGITLSSGYCYRLGLTLTDNVGNSSLTYSPAYKIDTAAPTGGTVVINAGATSTNNAAVTLTLSASDSASGLATMAFSNDGTNFGGPVAYSASSAYTLPAGDGSKTVYARFTDAAGNTSGNASASIILDTAAPSVSFSIDGGAGSTRFTSATLSINGADGGGSGVTLMRTSPDGSNWGGWVTYAASTAYTLSSGDGTKTVYLEVQDAAGNSSSPVNQAILLDTTSPSGSVVINGGASATNSTTLTLTLSASDPAPASGLATMAFSNDGTNWSSAQSYSASASWTVPSGDGTKTVYARFTDAAGNVSVSSSANILFEGTPPTGSVVINAGASYTNSTSVTLTLSASSASGVTSMRFSDNGTTFGSYVTYAISYAYTLPGGDGAKTVYAQFYDAAGNTSSTVSSSITLDATAPTGGSVVINAGASYAASTAVTLTLSATDPTSGLASMQFSNNGSSWGGWIAYSASAAWTLASGDGSKTVYAQFRDAAGNVSANATASIILDTVAPSGIIAINSGAAYTAVASVTLTLSASDPTSGVAWMQFSNNGSSWGSPVAYSASAVWTLSGGDGAKTVYARFTDAAGNVSAPVSASITLDSAAPAGGSVVINAGASYTASTGVTLTLSATDPTSGLSTMAFSNDGTTFGSPVAYAASAAWTLSGGDGSKTVYARFTDAAGNVSANASASIILDTVSPSGTITINGGAAYTAVASVTLTLSASDPAPASGLTDYRLSADGGSTFGSWTAYTASVPYTLSGADGSKTLTAQFRDAAGNLSSLASASVTLDRVAPSGSLVIDAGASTANSTSVTLTLSATDATSGVSSMQFSNDGVSWGGWIAYSTSAAYTLPAGDGSKTVYAQFRDAAGNVSANASASIILDTAAPSGSIVINAGASASASASVTLTLSATDSTSGVTSMRLSNDGANFGGYVSYATSYAWTLSGGDGSKTVYVQFRDAAGNVSASASASIILDTAAPTGGSVVINAGAIATNTTSVTLTLSASDPTSGVASMRFSNDGSNWSSYQSYTSGAAWTLSGGDGSKTVYAQFRDAAGNVSSPASSVILLDTTGPSGSIVIDAGAIYTSSASVTLTLSATSVSGVTSMRFSNDDANWADWVAYGTSAGYTLSGGDGTKTVYVQFRDGAGDLSNPASASIILDTAGPSGSIAIDAGAGATNNSSVSLTLSATDSGAGVTSMRLSNDGVTFGGYVSYATSYAWTLSGGDGSKTVYVQFRDAAGNVSGSVSASIALDTVAPSGSISIEDGATYATSHSVTLTLSASDPAPSSGLTSMRFSNDGSNWSSYQSYASGAAWILSAGDGAKTVYVQLRDAAGNVSGSASASIVLDSTAPTNGAIVIDAGAGSTGSPSVTLTLSASDSTSGVSSMRFSNDGSAWSSWTAYAVSASWTLAAGSDGSRTVYAQFRDAAGNFDAGTESASITLTTAPPSVSAAIASGTAGSDGWYISNVTVSITASSSVGIARVDYSIDGGDTQIYSGTPFAVNGSGPHTIDYTAYDNAGNHSSDTFALKIDTNDPTATVTPSGTLGDNHWYISPVVLTISASDATSGVISVTWSLDGGSAQAYNGPISVSANGLHALAYTLTDAAGNVARDGGYVFVIDISAPTISSIISSGTLGNAGWYRSDVGVSFLADDPDSGVAAVHYSLDGGASTSYSGGTVMIAGDGSHTLTYTATNNAGNISGVGSRTIMIDSNAPSVTAIVINNQTTDPTTHNQLLTIKVGGADVAGGSGVIGGQARLSTDGGMTWATRLSTDGGQTFVTSSGGWFALGNDGTGTVTVELNGSGVGQYAVAAQVADVAGNLSAIGGTNLNLQNPVVLPTVVAQAVVWDCRDTDQSHRYTATGGTIYWPVEVPLCIVPTLRTVSPGLNGINNWTATVVSPGAGGSTYTLLSNPNESQADVTWPGTATKTYPTAGLGTEANPFSFSFGRETSLAAGSVQSISIPLTITADVVWRDASGTVVLTQSNLAFSVTIQVIVKNSGTLAQP